MTTVLTPGEIKTFPDGDRVWDGTGWSPVVADPTPPPPAPRPIWEDIRPDGVDPVSAADRDADLIDRIPDDIRDIPPSLQIRGDDGRWQPVDDGHLYTLAEADQMLTQLGRRMDAGLAFTAAVDRALSLAEEIHDRACAYAREDIMREFEEKYGRLPPQHVTESRVLLRTARTGEQRRRLRVLAKQVKDRLHNLSRQVELARSIGSNVKASMNGHAGI